MRCAVEIPIGPTNGNHPGKVTPPSTRPFESRLSQPMTMDGMVT